MSRVTTESNDKVKVYICLFTCASTRAVHLELTIALSALSFLQAFRRFVGRRGLPSVLMSDNAKTFRSASSDIKKIRQDKKVQQHLTSKQVNWKFIIEKAPWWGGLLGTTGAEYKEVFKENHWSYHIDI